MKKLVMALVTVVVMLMGIFGSAYAGQMWIIIHHEAQGNHDETWTKCMPDDAWNGHDDHVGDWRSAESWPTKEECEGGLNGTATPTNTTEPTNTPVFTATVTLAPTDTNTPDPTLDPTATNTPVVSTATSTPDDPTLTPTNTTPTNTAVVSPTKNTPTKTPKVNLTSTNTSSAPTKTSVASPTKDIPSCKEVAGYTDNKALNYARSFAKHCDDYVTATPHPQNTGGGGDSSSGGAVMFLLGLLVTVLGFFGLNRRFAFQKA